MSLKYHLREVKESPKDNCQMQHSLSMTGYTCESAVLLGDGKMSRNDIHIDQGSEAAVSEEVSFWIKLLELSVRHNNAQELFGT